MALQSGTELRAKIHKRLATEWPRVLITVLGAMGLSALFSIIEWCLHAIGLQESSFLSIPVLVASLLCTLYGEKAVLMAFMLTAYAKPLNFSTLWSRDDRWWSFAWTQIRLWVGTVLLALIALVPVIKDSPLWVDLAWGLPLALVLVWLTVRLFPATYLALQGERSPLSEAWRRTQGMAGAVLLKLLELMGPGLAVILFCTLLFMGILKLGILLLPAIMVVVLYLWAIARIAGALWTQELGKGQTRKKTARKRPSVNKNLKLRTKPSTFRK